MSDSNTPRIRRARRRALFAALAVTLGSGAVACGTTTVDPPDREDTGTDTTTDTTADTGTDVLNDASVGCSTVEDGVCPDQCTQHTDYDCCMQSGGGPTWCVFSPEGGCGCAVEGPFAPPSLAAPR